MSETTQRAQRAEGIRTERRKQAGSTTLTGIKLTADESNLDRKTFEYRWAKDYGGRMAQLHRDDWDPAPENAVLGNEGEGTVGAKIGGTDESGKPYKMVLMRKRKDWYAEDQKEKQASIDEIDKDIRRGRSIEKAELKGEGVYTPDGGNTIR